MEEREVLKYYSNEELQIKIWELAKNREFCSRSKEGSYFKRPSILSFPKDITAKVLEGAVSFHLSVERWRNPLELENAREKDYEELRIGWDWIIDIDSSLGVEAGKEVAKEIINFLKEYGIHTYTIKFSGRRGFHIGIAFENFPKEVNAKKIEKWYPEMPRILSSFLREELKEKILEKLIKLTGGISNLIGDKEIGEISPYEFVEIEKDWGVRHLFRAPYSLHEKTFLVSVPVKNLNEFSEEIARPENINFKLNFLDKFEENSLNGLISDAFSWWNSKERKENYLVELKKDIKKLEKWIAELKRNLLEKEEKYNQLIKQGKENEAEEIVKEKEYIKQRLKWLEEKLSNKSKELHEFSLKKVRKEIILPKQQIKRKITEEFFPPCIKRILSGIDDGRKRSCFTLITFLRNCNWNWEEVENKLIEWGKKVGLKENFLKSQLNWHKKQKEKILPANCSNDLFYKDIGICKPDEHCSKIKNPLGYPLLFFKKFKENNRKTT